MSTPKPWSWSSDQGITMRLADLAHNAVWSLYNETVKETAKALGARRIEWVTEIDSSTCDYCDGQSGRQYHLGHFLPTCPAHVGCRCYLDFGGEEYEG